MKAIYLLLSLFALLGCSPRVQVVERERIKTEYKDRLRLLRDSLYLHDSIYVERKGDTVYQDRWHTRYTERLVLDTAYIELRDSIRVPVVVEVPKPTSWLHRLELNAYRLVLLLVLIFIGWKNIKPWLWRRRL